MSNHSIPLSDAVSGEYEVGDVDHTITDKPTEPPVDNRNHTKGISSFWYDRIIEISLILSMAAYYVIGNKHLGTGFTSIVISAVFADIRGIVLVSFTNCHRTISFDITLLFLPKDDI